MCDGGSESEIVMLQSNNPLDAIYFNGKTCAIKRGEKLLYICKSPFGPAIEVKTFCDITRKKGAPYAKSYAMQKYLRDNGYKEIRKKQV